VLVTFYDFARTCGVHVDGFLHEHSFPLSAHYSGEEMLVVAL
jgi:hypothetical protein